MLLVGFAILVAGFALRVQPLLVILLAAGATGLAAGLSPLATLAAFGHAFNANRLVTVIYVVLPLIGFLERHGLQERARGWIAALRGATAGRLLAGYMACRQITAALGLVSIAGQAQTVRPLLAPMAEGAGGRQGALPPEGRARLRAWAAATDNIAVFFGEDIFLAIGSILLMKGVLDGFGLRLEPLAFSRWAIPPAIAAFLLHGARLWRLDRRIARGGRP